MQPQSQRVTLHYEPATAQQHGSSFGIDIDNMRVRDDSLVLTEN